MLGNCEKMVLISSTTNEWPQNHIADDPKAAGGLMLMASATAPAAGSSSSSRVMDKPITQDQQQQLQQQQQALKCPRCDSSNTKFCYYNNYSLSQPRHFCKSCKRYWTRGGTLRNVPVGGGCRKNKRVKRPSSSSSSSSSTSDHLLASSSSAAPTTTSLITSIHQQLDLSTAASNHLMSPLLNYGLLPPNHSHDLNNVPLPRGIAAASSRVSAGYDDHIQPQMSALGLGFSSGLVTNIDHIKQIQDAVTSSSPPSSSVLLPSYQHPVYGSSSATMASLLATLQQQKLVPNNGVKDVQAVNNFQELVPYEELQVNGGVKMEDGQRRFGWINGPNHDQNRIEHQINNYNSSSDPAAAVLWNSNGVGAWLDGSNMAGPSVLL